MDGGSIGGMGGGGCRGEAYPSATQEAVAGGAFLGGVSGRTTRPRRCWPLAANGWWMPCRGGRGSRPSGFSTMDRTP